MSRPLLVTDCDEVLLHMVRPWSGWLGEAKPLNPAGLAKAHCEYAFGPRIVRKQIGQFLDRGAMAEARTGPPGLFPRT